MAKNYKKVSILFSVWFRVSLVFVLFGVGLVLPLWAEAAVLYLEPSQGEYYQGDTFVVFARIDTEKECVNTVKADISFSADVLEAVDFSYGNSILTIVPEAPEIRQDSGLISFLGGIPGGYCGILPGDPGESNLLGRIVFQVRETDTKPEHETDAKIDFSESSQVLLNDGLGTLAELTTEGAIFTILPKPFDAAQGRDEWREELEKDKTPPEPFEIEINQDPSTFEGKYFITFNTTDKQSGIDYYQAKEGKKDWQEAQSPHVLEDQSLKGIIKVRAVDKAGNERIARYGSEISVFWIWALVGLAVIILIWFVIKKYGRLRFKI